MLFRILGSLLGGGRHYRGRRRHGSFGSALKGRLLIGVVMLAFAFISYKMGTKEVKNPITGEMQTITMSPEEEIALGLHSAPKMAQQHGGVVAPSDPAAQLVKQIGEKIISANELEQRSPYEFDFHLLADKQTINAFALPGGQTFITYALLSKLDRNSLEDQLAGIIGHEIAHVIARHSTQQIAKSKLTAGIANVANVVIGGGHGSYQLSAMVNKVLNTRYGREDELESDALGLRFMNKAGYNPRAMIRVMEILGENSGGSRPPEILSTHPSSENRIRRIKEYLATLPK